MTEDGVLRDVSGSTMVEVVSAQLSHSAECES